MDVVMRLNNSRGLELVLQWNSVVHYTYTLIEQFIFITYIIMSPDTPEYREFQEVMKPIMEYLDKNHNPHTTIIVTPSGAEMTQWVMSCSNPKYQAEEKLEVLILEASDVLEKFSEHMEKGEFGLVNGSFSVKFDKKLSELK